MTDPFVAFDIMMDAIAQGVADGVRIWALTVAAAVATVVLCAWLYERTARRNEK